MKLIVLFVLAVFVSGLSQAQTIDNTLQTYADKFQPEKIYIHYDKSSYLPGETIWYKTYLMEEIYPATASKTVYVDWIGDNGKVLAHTVSPIVDAVSSGQFEIPFDYASDIVHVRAYTNWMLNFDTAFLYQKDIKIINQKTSAAKAVIPAIIPTLQFFPEGGDIISGVSGKVAFKATDQWGRPVKVSGVVQDEKGTVVDSIKTLHDGMGIFSFLAQPGQNYTARWRMEKGQEYRTPMPVALSGGVSLQIGSSGAKRVIYLSRSLDLADRFKLVHIVGTMNQRLAFKTDVDLSQAQEAVRRSIPLESFPTGILTVTVFDAGWNPFAERILFVNNGNFSFNTNMEVVRWGLSKRKRNEIRLDLPDSLAGANLSVAVTDAGIETDSSDNIISHLLLTSDIKGQVNNPAQYFQSKSDATAQQLDLVMLTNGWRRLNWQQVVKGKLPTITNQRDTSYLTLSGQVFGVAKGVLSGKESIVLIIKSKDSVNQMAVLPIETSGRFSDPSMVFFDSMSVYYSLKSQLLRQAEARFMVNRLPAPDYKAFSRSLLNYRPFTDTTGLAYHNRITGEALRLEEIKRGKMMEAVVVKARQKTPTQLLDEKYASALFKTGDGYQFDLVNDPVSSSYLDIFSYLQGKVAGLQITGSGPNVSLTWRNQEPALFLDEFQADISLLQTVPVSNIAYVKVIRPPFVGATGGGGGGAIAIYTRKGNDAQNIPGTGLSTNKIAGYTLIREFYSPNYDKFDIRNEQPDVRTTLYWNPIVQPARGKNSITLVFYNNDLAKSFRVIVEGMSADGLLTHYETIME